MPYFEYYYLVVEISVKGVKVGNLQPSNKSLSIICDKARELSRQNDSITEIYKMTASTPQYTRLCYRFNNGVLTDA